MLATDAEGEVLHKRLRQRCRVDAKSVGGGTDLVVMPPTASNQRAQKQGGNHFPYLLKPDASDFFF